MIIIAGNSHVSLAKQVGQRLGVDVVIADTKRFDDQELRIQIDRNMQEQDVVIIQSTSKPANDHLMELLLIADTVKRAGARRIIAVMPYFGYSRQDRPSYRHGPISASLVASLIKASGVDTVITIDLHSKQSEGFFKRGVHNLDSLPLFVPLFQNMTDCVIVSPDIGGIPRARAFANALGAELAIINKSRQQDGACVMREMIGDVRDKNCILIDDIIDTGGTLCQASNLLHIEGCKSISACITHGVFSSESLKKVKAANFNKFYITDTISSLNLPDNIEIISVDKIISDELQRFIIK